MKNIPQRSLFGDLEPRGRNSSQIEAQTSYIDRFSYIYGANYQTFFDILFSQDNSRKPRLSSIMGHPESLNGWSDTAILVSSLLNKSTGRNDLYFLTLLPWFSYFSQNANLNHFKKWCPLCLMEMKEKVIYDPLLWQIKFYQYCHIHEIKLLDTCPKCGAVQRLLLTKSEIGFCNECQSFLGVHINTNNRLPLSAKNKFYFRSSCELASFMEYVSKHQNNRSNFISSNLRLLRKQLTGNPSQIAEKTNISISMINSCAYRGMKPNYKSILTLCVSLNLDFKKFITEVWVKGEQPIVIVQGIKPNKTTEGMEEEKIIELFSYIKKTPPVPVSKIVADLNVNRSYLYENYPLLMQELSLRFEIYQLGNTIKKFYLKYENLKLAFDAVKKKGKKPTQYQITNYLNNPYFFYYDKLIVKQWKKMIAELDSRT